MTTPLIVAGFDGSPESNEALDWAADEAVARGSRIEIVSCYRIPPASDVYTGLAPIELGAELMDTVSDVAAAARDRILATHPTLDISARVGAGIAAHELVARSPDAVELIVLGASSHRSASAFWLGSTPRAVVRRARCPVVVVRGTAGRGRPNRVVVGVDGSDNALAALRWAADEADLHGVSLVVVHAWEYPYELSMRTNAQVHDLMRVDAALVLDAAVESAREVCDGAVTGELIEASPASSMIGVVRDCDLLVLGSRGRGALMSGLFGSTVNRVLDDAVVPVAVVRAEDPR